MNELIPATVLLNEWWLVIPVLTMSMNASAKYPMIESESLFDTPNGTGTPERRLLLAVLERAILDYVGNDQREIEEASQWLFSDLEEPEYGEFSFAWICRELDLDYKKISRQIREMPKRGNSRIAPWYLNKESTPRRALMN